ncbi:MAG: RecX family transcriptional regulator [Peptococcaceae bacterium]|nr:RecX family transcriptional regulator [Peptococcaceae bacterium]
MYSEQFEKARKAAYRILTYRARTEYEISEKLLRKGFDRETINQVIASLRDYRLLDDQAYAERFVAEKRSLPRAVVSGKLRSLGVKESVIQKVLEGVDPEAEFRIALSLALNRKKRRGDGYPIESMAAFLKRRGFSQEAVDRVCTYLDDMRQPGS